MDDYEIKKWGPIEVLVMKSNGYINATKVCNLFNKELRKWTRLAEAASVTNALAKQLNVDASALKIVSNKGKQPYSGTYIHPKLGFAVLRWCSPETELNLDNNIMCTMDTLPVVLPVNAEPARLNPNSGIYLIEIGLVSDLETHLAIPDFYSPTSTVYKYGTSYDIQKRLDQHKVTYSCNITLIYSQAIDLKYRYAAEADLKRLLQGIDVYFSTDKYYELAIFPSKTLECVKALFDSLYLKYKRMAK